MSNYVHYNDEVIKQREACKQLKYYPLLHKESIPQLGKSNSNGEEGEVKKTDTISIPVKIEPGNQGKQTKLDYI